VFCGRLDDGKQTLCPCIKLKEINAKISEKDHPGILKVIEIIAVPNDLHRIDIVKWHPMKNLIAVIMVSGHDTFP
jgi:hypothetical protein